MRTFFGLRPEDREQLILEPAFLLGYYLGYSYTEVYNMPVAYKAWFIRRVSEEIAKANNPDNPTAPPGSKAAHQNSPDIAAILGRRTDAPAKLRRFSPT